MFYMLPQIGVAFVKEQSRLAEASFGLFPVDECIEEIMILCKEGNVCKLCDLLS